MTPATVTKEKNAEGTLVGRNIGPYVVLDGMGGDPGGRGDASPWNLSGGIVPL